MFFFLENPITHSLKKIKMISSLSSHQNFTILQDTWNLRPWNLSSDNVGHVSNVSFTVYGPNSVEELHVEDGHVEDVTELLPVDADPLKHCQHVHLITVCHKIWKYEIKLEIKFVYSSRNENQTIKFNNADNMIEFTK